MVVEVEIQAQHDGLITFASWFCPASAAAYAPGLTSPTCPYHPAEERTWGTGKSRGLWTSMSLCIPTYMLASFKFIEGGMNCGRRVLTIFLATVLIVLVPSAVQYQPARQTRSVLICQFMRK
jgi:hypothetical protein